MGYISVVCSNPDCFRETTRKEDTEYCPHCGHYTSPITSLQPKKLEQPAPLVNKNIPHEVLQKISQVKPLEFDGHDLTLIMTLLEEKQTAALEKVVQLEAENPNAANTKQHVYLCSVFDQCMNIQEKIKTDIKRKRAEIEIKRRMTGFYSKPENQNKKQINFVGEVAE